MSPNQSDEHEPSSRTAALNETELAQQDAVDLPPREAMTILDLMPAATGGVPVPPAAGGGLQLSQDAVQSTALPEPDATAPYESTRSASSST